MAGEGHFLGQAVTGKLLAFPLTPIPGIRTRGNPNMKSFITLVILIAVGAVAFIFSGAYDVAAIRPHGRMVKKVISATVDNSIKRRAKGIKAPGLEDSAMIKAGFHEVEEMCVICHTAPGVRAGSIGKAMYPKAPGLKRAVEEWNASQLFWIVKNGIKMTGMPAFGPTYDEKTLWSIVAFLRQVPALDSVGYEALRQKWGEEVRQAADNHPGAAAAAGNPPLPGASAPPDSGKHPAGQTQPAGHRGPR